MPLYNPVRGTGVSVIDMTIGTAATQSSSSLIPANAIVLSTNVSITSAYPNGTVINVGQASVPDLLQGTSDNYPALVSDYAVTQRIAWGSVAQTVLVTIGGSPSSGSAQVTVSYIVPLS